MTLSELNRNSIESISTISCGDVSHIQAVPNMLARMGITDGNVPDHLISGADGDAIVDFSGRLHHLKWDLDNDKRSLIRRIIDFVCSIFTGRFCIVWRLSRSLSDVIIVVDAAAQFILQRRAELAQPDDDEPPTPPPLVNHEPPPPPPADIDGIPAEVFAAKKKLVGRVIDLTKTEGSKYPLANVDKIRRFFEKLQERLNKDKNALIPRYCHSTKDDKLEAILKDRQLKVLPAALGTGVFIATENETIPFGPHTFVFDEFLLGKIRATYYEGANSRDWTQKKLQPPDGYPENTKPRMWICLKQNVPITSKTVSCMVVANVSKLAEVLKNHEHHDFNPRTLEEGDDKELADNDLPIFTVAEGDAIVDLVQIADKSWRLPSNWKYSFSFDDIMPA